MHYINEQKKESENKTISKVNNENFCCLQKHAIKKNLSTTIEIPYEL